MIFWLLKSPALMTFHGVFPRANWGRRRQLSGPGIRWPFPVLGGHGGCCSLGAKRRCCAPIWQCVKTLYPCSSHQNSWGLLMFIPLKMVLIGIDPYPYDPICIICAPKLIAHDFSYGRTASNFLFLSCLGLPIYCANFEAKAMAQHVSHVSARLTRHKNRSWNNLWYPLMQEFIVSEEYVPDPLILAG